MKPITAILRSRIAPILPETVAEFIYQRMSRGQSHIEQAAHYLSPRTCTRMIPSLTPMEQHLTFVQPQ